MSSSRNDVEFVKGALEERYKCIACRLVLQNPMQSSCGHRFCYSCIEAIFQKDPSQHKCPDDGEVLLRNNVFRDKCAQREVLGLLCFCYNKSRGCQWIGELLNLQSHNDECPFAEVKCLYYDSGCEVVVLRHQLAKHVENDCLFKAVSCPYCGLAYAGVKMREHLEECSKFPIKCPYGCDQDEFPREEILEHENSCPKVEVKCSFSAMGCSFRGPRESLEEHIGANTAQHLVLSGKYIQELKGEMENLQLQLKAAEELNQTYEARIAMQNEQIALNKQALSTHQLKLAGLEENMILQQQITEELRQSLPTFSLKPKERELAGEDVGDLMRRLDFQDQRMSSIETRLDDPRSRFTGGAQYGERASLGRIGGNNAQLDRLEHSLSLHEIQLADQDLKLQILQASSYDGTYLWKIDEFKRRFRESVEGKTISIYSPPFYTSRNGYKLCARAYLNGDGPTGKGKFMSLFIVIMRGDNDALLSWPFRQRITFKLLDQDRISDVSETFRPDPNSSSFQRPRSDMNIASGCPTFCSHSLLRSRGYIRDDTIFIKVIVDTVGLAAI
ncbi:TNF receptor-associated factor 3-like [Acropora millepora]|uniref:TNF receptor-associated factor 3-like n=1 Tax=Acropora millepora TaxID=45264 RepID=UPI001CF1B945|nr:TNF receptor-associated factor 3-like [Acropora millepora]